MMITVVMMMRGGVDCCCIFSFWDPFFLSFFLGSVTKNIIVVCHRWTLVAISERLISVVHILGRRTPEGTDPTVNACCMYPTKNE